MTCTMNTGIKTGDDQRCRWFKKTKKKDSLVCQKRIGLTGNFSLDYVMAIPVSVLHVKLVAITSFRAT